jgi:phage shock protein C
MNKIFNINLGNAPFVIDDNAYEALSQYISGLRQHFANSEGCDEIVADIEARIAELLTEYLKERQIVTLADVKRAIGVMGIPTEIDGETTDTMHTGSGSFDNRRFVTGKRLFRNEDDKVVSGVCSGLAAYFGIQDPLWIRLAFAAAVLLGAGFPILIYLILLVIVPKAVTAADKLAMRGESVNVDNIARTVETELGNIGTRLGEFGNEIGDRFNGKKFDGNANGSRGVSYSSGTETITTVFKWGIKGFILFIISTVVFSLGATWFGFMLAGIKVQPYMHYFVESPMLGYTAWIATMAAIIIPIIALILVGIRIFYKRVRINPIAKWSLALGWIGSLVTLLMVAIMVFQQFSNNESTTREVSLDNPDANTMLLQFVKASDNNNMSLSFGNMRLEGDKLITDDIELDIEESPDAQFHLIQKSSSYGSSSIDAKRHAEEIKFNVTQTDSSLLFDRDIYLPKGEKARWQNVRLTLQVPIGKQIRIKNPQDWNFYHFLDNVKFAGDNDDNDLGDLMTDQTHTWRMTQNGLVCSDCSEAELNGDNEEEEYSSNNENASDSLNNINIDADGAKLKLDEDGVKIEARDKESGDKVKIKIDKDGLIIKKNGKTIKDVKIDTKDND